MGGGNLCVCAGVHVGVGGASLRPCVPACLRSRVYGVRGKGGLLSPIPRRIPASPLAVAELHCKIYYSV